MPLGTLDRSPPPFFRQGPSALSRLIFFASLSVCLMAADTRLGLTGPLRTAVAVLLHPIERSLLAPVNGVESMRGYIGGITEARRATETARTELTRQAERSLQAEQLLQENAHLRALLELRGRLTTHTRAAEVLYDSADPYSRKIIIDRGSTQGVRHGSPVLNEQGVLGQVTRVYPLTAEITLVVDENAAIPVNNTRTGHRGVAYGDPAVNGMELRFVAANADVRVGDVLQTSGLDGVYPPGVPVATVIRLDRRTQSDFAKIALKPAVSVENVHHVLVLDPIGLLQPPPPAASDASLPAHSKDAAASKPGSSGAKPSTRKPARKG